MFLLFDVGGTKTRVAVSPDIVVIGGGVMESVSLERVQEYVLKIHRAFPDTPEIVRAALGDAAGLWGAMALLRDKLSAGA